LAQVLREQHGIAAPHPLNKWTRLPAVYRGNGRHDGHVTAEKFQTDVRSNLPAQRDPPPIPGVSPKFRGVSPKNTEVIHEKLMMAALAALLCSPAFAQDSGPRPGTGSKAQSSDHPAFAWRGYGSGHDAPYRAFGAVNPREGLSSAAREPAPARVR
jgi:hypothetical protein